MKELSESDLLTVKQLLDKMDKFQDSLRKDVVHALRGADPAKLSIKKFDSAISVAKRVSDEFDKDIKKLKKLLK